MLRRFPTPLVVALALPLLHAQPAAHQVAITHVNLVDVVAGVIRPDQTVLLANGKITAAGPAATIAAPQDATLVPGAGLYLVPGFWDSHVHLRSDSNVPQTRLAAENEAMLDLFLPNGVVGICEMGGDLADQVIRWRDAIRAGRMEGPQILTAGRKIDNDPPAWPGSIGVKTAEEARQAVDQNKALGADFIKVYFRTTTPEIFRAVIDEAHKLHMKVTGHKPVNMPLQELIETGIDGMQHAEFLPATTREVFDALQRERASRASTPWTLDPAEFTARFFALEDLTEDARLYQQMAKIRFWVTPTLAVENHILEHGVHDYETDERKHYFAPAIWHSWDPAAGVGTRKPMEGRALALRQAITKRWQQTALAAFKAGVPMILGTDSGTDNVHMMPGWSTHEELEALVQVGLTPAEALRLATVNAAQWRGDADAGEIGPGKVADLVLLRSNPLSDIRHTKEVESVFQAGRYYPRTSLDAMLARAADRARSLGPR